MSSQGKKAVAMGYGSCYSRMTTEMCCRLKERDGMLVTREKKRVREKERDTHTQRKKKENVARAAVTGKTTTTGTIIIIIVILGNRETMTELRNIQEGVVAKSRLVRDADAEKKTLILIDCT